MAEKTRLSNIAFFCPSRGFGGAENLVLKLSGVLISRGYSVTIIDYSGGIVISDLSGVPGISFIEYEDNKPVFVKDVSHIICSSYWVETIKEQVVAADKVFLLIWFIHPYHIFRFIKPIPRARAYFLYLSYRNKIARMFELINRKGSLKFMDYENYYMADKYFNFNFKPEYLPIPITTNAVFNKKPIATENLSVTWIGRLAPEKGPILLYVLDQVREYSIRKGLNVNFYIVGSGLFENSLNDYIKNNVFDYVKIYRIDFISPEDLPEFLSDKSLLFAMGTAALEGGAQRIPTVLLDYSYFDYLKIKEKGYRFKWLYQTENFTLGSDIFNSFVSLDKKNKMCIDDVFAIILNTTDRETVALDCYNYTINNHNINSVVSKLLNDLDSCSYSTGDLSSFDLAKSKMELLIDKVHIHGVNAKRRLNGKPRI
jgi:glycosyltransferase involved in cell wall biosynthesis